MKSAYEAIIGLEIHVQLKTKSKMFCSCQNMVEGAPNTAICPVCTGQPGTLPVANEQAIQWAAKTALAIGCAIAPQSKFDRKNYFYPDLPKGYQISQYDQPIGTNGLIDLTIDGLTRQIHITRLHLEEDAAKLTHPAGSDMSLVDFNRAGTPLVEIVTEPDFRSPEEVKQFLHELRQIIRYLGVSDADMEKGHFRCDPNISLRPLGDGALYAKTEVKNLNSFRSIERALAYEIERQTELWNNGQAPTTSSTRGWDEDKQETVAQRSKEEAADYRYFPEPDLPPLVFERQDVNRWKAELPELPADRRQRFAREWHLKDEDIAILVEQRETADFAEQVVSEMGAWYRTKHPADWEKRFEAETAELAQATANWLINRLPDVLLKSGRTLDTAKLTAENMAELILLVKEKTISAAKGNEVLAEMVTTGRDPSDIIEAKGLQQVSDSGAIGAVIDTVLAENAKVVDQYKGGKTTVLQFLVGQVMKAMKGKADAAVVSELLKKRLT